MSDELFGWGVIRIDESFFRIKDANGDTVAAIGDQGNLYLSGTLSQWYDADLVEGSANVGEVLIESGSTDNVVALFDDSGNLLVEQLVHGGMDDLNDSCDTVEGNDSEQDYLDNPTACALKISHGDHTVAYIDNDGNVRLRGKVFENWSDWDFLD